MTEEAEVYFYDWYNNIIDNVNSIDDDADVESRSMNLMAMQDVYRWYFR